MIYSLVTSRVYLVRAALTAGAGALILSCTSLSLRRVEEFADITAEGDYAAGIEQIRSSKQLYGDRNAFLYFLDIGILFHYAGEFDSSLHYLGRAEQVLDDLYARSITNEAASLLTNDNLRPYRSRRYERILLHQFLSFNYLARGELDESLVETRKVQLVFESYAEKDKGKSKYREDGMSHFLSAMVYTARSERDNAAISLFKSVRAYRDGPIELPGMVRDLAYHELMEAGREDDVKLLGLTPGASKNEITGLDDDRSEIVLVGYAGKSPILDEQVFWGTYVVDGLLVIHYRDPRGDMVTATFSAPPLPEVEREKREGEEKDKVKSGSTFHIKFALPTAVRRHSETSHFAVGVDSAPSHRTEVLTNTDLLLEKDLEDNWNAILLRTAVRVVLRTIAAQKAKREMATESPVANLLINVGTDALSSQLEKADTRMCFLLPQTVQLARIPVEPGSHRVTAQARGRSGEILDSKTWEAVEIRPGDTKFLFFPSVR